MSVQINSLTGREAQPFINDLAQLRIEVFHDFPYLYDGDIEYEREYLTTYTKSENSLLVLAFDEGRVVGASSGIPMIFETENIKKPWQEKGYDISQLFYFGESVLKKEYRGLGVGVKFFEERENYAKSLGQKTCTFCSVVRPANHPLKPSNYFPLDKFWKNRGYTKQDNMICNISWKDIGDEKEKEHSLVFWKKDF